MAGEPAATLHASLYASTLDGASAPMPPAPDIDTEGLEKQMQAAMQSGMYMQTKLFIGSDSLEALREGVRKARDEEGILGAKLARLERELKGTVLSNHQLLRSVRQLSGFAASGRHESQGGVDPDNPDQQVDLVAAIRGRAYAQQFLSREGIFCQTEDGEVAFLSPEGEREIVLAANQVQRYRARHGLRPSGSSPWRAGAGKHAASAERGKSLTSGGGADSYKPPGTHFSAGAGRRNGVRAGGVGSGGLPDEVDVSAVEDATGVVGARMAGATGSIGGRTGSAKSAGTGGTGGEESTDGYSDRGEIWDGSNEVYSAFRKPPVRPSSVPTALISGQREAGATARKPRPLVNPEMDHLDTALLARLARERKREGSADFSALEARLKKLGKELNDPAYSDWSPTAYYRLLGLRCTAFHQVKHRLYQHLLRSFGVPTAPSEGGGENTGMDPLQLLIIEAARTGDDSRLSALLPHLSGPPAVYLKGWLAVSRSYANVAFRIDRKLEMALRALASGAPRGAGLQVGGKGRLERPGSPEPDIRDPGTACLIVSPELSLSRLTDVASIDFSDTARARLQMHGLLDFLRQALS